MGNKISTLRYKTHLQHTSIDRCTIVIAGYIRNIRNLNSIVPKEIDDLIYTYYKWKHTLYWINIDNYIYTASVHPYTKKLINTRKSNFTDILKDHHYSDSGICTTNISNNCDKIFKCGGIRYTNLKFLSTAKYPTDSCLSITINRDKCKISKVDILPHLPQPIAGNCVLYDQQYGLLSIGGYTQRHHNLKAGLGDIRYFNTNCNNFYQLFHDKWVEMPSMSRSLSYPSGVIWNALNYKKIIIVGRQKNIQINVYDFDKETWREHNVHNWTPCWKFGISPGICYDEYNNNEIYIGGGALHGQWKWDMIKNKWMRLPYTHDRYGKRSLLWFDKMDKNLLFIACCQTNNMEYIDVRVGKHWKIVHSERWNKKCLIETFGVRDKILNICGCDESRLLIS